MQERRTSMLAAAAGAVLVVAVLAAVVTWQYVRGAAGSSGNPLAIGVVFAAVLTAGAVALLILSGRGGPSARPGSPSPGAPSNPAVPESAPDPDITEVATSGRPDEEAGEVTRQQPAVRPRTALDPLGRRYGRHARPEAAPGTGHDPAADGPSASELFHPLPDDLATTLHDELFTHRGATAGRD